MADIETQLPVRSDIPDQTAIIIGSTEVFPFGAYADETAPDSVSEGDIGALRMTLTRLLKTKLIGDNAGADVNVAVDGSGNLQTASTSEYAEDSAHASGDIGTFILAVRSDAGTPLAADGDYHPLMIDANGRLRVDAEFTAAFDYAEDTAHTTGAAGAFVLGVRNDAAAALTSADGDYSAFATDSAGRIGIADLGGSVSVDDNGGSITVDGTVAVSSVGGSVTVVDGGGSLTVDGTVTITDGGGSITVDGTVTADTNFDFAEDSAHASGDIGAFVLAVRNDTFATTLTSATGDYSPIAVDSTGKVFVASNKIEDAAHASGDVGNFILAVRNDTPGSLVGTDGDYAPLQVDSTGALRISAGGTFTPGDNKLEDAVHASGDTGSFILAVRADTQGTLSSASGDYDAVQTTEEGAVRVAQTWSRDPALAICNYDTVAAVANNATGTISYDRTGLTTTFLLKQIIATSSGAPCKVEVTHTAGATTVAVGFYATSSPVLVYTFAQPIPVTDTSATAVSVAITNRAGPAQDVYATIIGEEV